MSHFSRKHSASLFIYNLFCHHVLLLILLVLPILLYYQGLSGPFIGDDFHNIVNNNNVHLFYLLPSDLLQAAKSYSHDGNLLRAISMLSFAGNYYWGGMNPSYFKLVNLVIHLCNCFALYVLVSFWMAILKRDYKENFISIDSKWFSFLVALTWAVHPINLTNIIYVVQRMNSLSCFFVILGMALYSKGRLRIEEKGRSGILLMLIALIVCTPLAFYSKENGILLPLLLLLIEWLFFRFSVKSLVKGRFVKVYFLVGVAIPLVFGGVFFLLNYESYLGGYEIRAFSLEQRMLTEPRVLFFYLKLLLFPKRSDFTLFHDDIALSNGLFNPLTTFFSIICLIGLMGSALYLRRRMPFYSFCILFFLVAHSLESTIFPLEIAFEHRNYVPGIGVIALVSYAIFSIPVSNFIGKVRNFVVFLLVTSFCVTTLLCVRDWRNSDLLTIADVKYHPNSARAQHAIGNLYGSSMLTDPVNMVSYSKLAEKHFKRAAELNSYSRNGALLALVKLYAIVDGNIDSSLERQLLKDLATLKSSVLATNNFVSLLSCLHSDLCHLPETTSQKLVEAFAENKNIRGKELAQVYAAAVNLAVKHKRLRLALDYAERAWKLNPNQLQHHVNYATILILLGDFEMAKTHLDKIRVSDTLGDFNYQVENLENIINAKLTTPMDAGG